MATKTNLPAMPFYVGDWLKCPEVKVLPPDVRGLWFEMICYMWESVERGVMVKPNKRPYSNKEIVKMVGDDCNGTGEWLNILLENGVCSIRKEDGAIYCRRMVKEEMIRKVRSEAGHKGARARLENTPAPIVPHKAPELSKVSKKKNDKKSYADDVTLTSKEFDKLRGEYGEEGAKRMIKILSNYKGSKGKKYKSDYKAILSWVVDKYQEEKNINNGTKNRISRTARVNKNQTAQEEYSSRF